MGSEVPEPKTKAKSWDAARFLVPILLLIVGVGLWQIWERAKVGPKAQGTLLTTGRTEAPPQAPPQPLAPPAPAAAEESLTDAEQILLKCASIYAQATSWRASYTLDSVATAGATELPQSVSVQVAVQRPNKYRQVSAGGGLMGVSLNSSTICDGANVNTYMESLKQVLTAPAPKSLAELARMLGPEMSCQVNEVGLMAGANPLDGVAEVSSSGTEEVNGHTCYVLELSFKGDALGKGVQGLLQKQEKEPPSNFPFRATSGSQRLWIDSTTFLIWKQRLNMTMDLRSAAQQILGGELLSSALPEALEKTVIQTYSEVYLDELIPDSWFTFSRPPGVKVVEHLDLSVLLEEMLVGQ